ncbi:MAG: hypothetical protein ACUZ8O_14080 [Candidatus Anammoxibacter sp.]
MRVTTKRQVTTPSNMEENKAMIHQVLANINGAMSLRDNNDSVRIVAVVSGSDVDRESWEKRLKEISPYIFNRNGSSLVLSLQEKIGNKTRQGNFLGTLLAYQNIKEACVKHDVPYRDFVAMVGMLFGRGERMSPITQCKGCRKPAIEVTPANIKINNRKVALTAVEEALFYFTPVAKYLEKRGFRGILNKWGDETEIPSVDFAGSVENRNLMKEHDVVKIISVVEITDELAKQKDWVVFDDSQDMIGQLSRNNRVELIKQLTILGIKPNADGRCYAGISLGPVAVSYDVLDIAFEVFEYEIKEEGIYFDFDPYLLMALAMKDTEQNIWEEKGHKDKDLQELVRMIPDFFAKVQQIKKIFKTRYNRNLNLKTLDFGKDTYWADIGQHSSMREKYLSLNDCGEKGIIARKIANIEKEKDQNGNIIINSELPSDIYITNSVIVNSKITGKGKINNSTIIDSEFADIDMDTAFAIRSIRQGSSVLSKYSGLFESLGVDNLVLGEKMRHVSLLTSFGKMDMEVSEDSDLRDKENIYNLPILNNKISFAEAFNEMLGTSIEKLEERRMEAAKQLNRIMEMKNKFKPLSFGTSGLRDKVENMTDMECYINTGGFIKFLFEKGEITDGNHIAVGGDLRSSTPRIIVAVVKAIENQECKPVYCGRVPTPTLTYYGQEEGIPSIMVTGSHIPEDRNGIKFTKKFGEVLKTDEKDILRNVEIVRNAEYGKTVIESLFNDKGMFKAPGQLIETDIEADVIDLYIKRYLSVFSAEALKGKKIVLYEHSAVGRDTVKTILEGLGAHVISVGRSDKFISVDTEKVSDNVKKLFKKWAVEHKPFAILSTDGDSDRPLFADENGEILPGDKLGALVSVFLVPDFAAIPISANDAVVKALSETGIKVVQTRIGSPYVIAAMDDELEKSPDSKVVSWESNGGFLLGSTWTIAGNELKKLPTRDAMLPLIATLVFAANEEKPVSGLITAKLPARCTHADVVDDNTPGCETYTAILGKKIINYFSPENKDVKELDFNGANVNIKGRESIKQEKEELFSVRNKLGLYFNKETGFCEITSINFIDGIRIVFANGDVAHLRPSGNAPEFRMYATGNTQKRANEIVELLKQIIPKMIKDINA